MITLSAGDGTYKFDLFINEYVADTRNLSYEEKGLLMDIVVWLYRVGGYLPLDPAELGEAIGADRRIVKRVLPRLIDKGKLCCDDARIWCEKAVKQLGEIADRSAKGKARRAARQAPAAPSPESSSGLLEDFSNNSSTIPPDLSGKIEEDQSLSGHPSPSPSTVYKKEEEVGCAAPPGAYAFIGQSVKLNGKDYARLKAEHPAIPDFDAALRVIDADVTEKGGKWWFPLAKKLGYMQLDFLARKQNAVAASAKPKNPQADRRWNNRVVNGQIVVGGRA